MINHVQLSMINPKVINNQISLLHNAARAKDKNTQILHKFRILKGPLKFSELVEIPGEVDYKEKMAVGE